MIDEAFLHFRSDLTPSWDRFLQQENGDVNNELLQRKNIEPCQLKLVLFLLILI